MTLPPPPPPPPPPRGPRIKIEGRPRSPVRGGKIRTHARKREIDLTGVDPKARVRLIGLLTYVRSMGMSLRQIWQQTPLDGDEPDGLLISDVVTYEVFTRWAHDDRWSDERDRMWEHVKQKSLEVVGGEMVQHELAAIHRLSALREQIEARFPDTEAKSFEGLVAVMLRVEEQLSTKRFKIAELVPRAMAAPAVEAEGAAIPTPATPAIEDGLDDEDIAAMVRAVLERRMAGGE